MILNDGQRCYARRVSRRRGKRMVYRTPVTSFAALTDDTFKIWSRHLWRSNLSMDEARCPNLLGTPA